MKIKKINLAKLNRMLEVANSIEGSEDKSWALRHIAKVKALMT